MAHCYRFRNNILNTHEFRADINRILQIHTTAVNILNQLDYTAL